MGTQSQLGGGLGASSMGGGGLFGANQPKLGATGIGGGGLFGGTPQVKPGGGLFGGQQTSQAAGTLGGGGLFGGAATSGTGLFNQSAAGTQLGGLGGQTQVGGAKYGGVAIFQRSLCLSASVFIIAAWWRGALQPWRNWSGDWRGPADHRFGGHSGRGPRKHWWRRSRGPWWGDPGLPDLPSRWRWSLQQARDQLGGNRNLGGGGLGQTSGLGLGGGGLSLGLGGNKLGGGNLLGGGNTALGGTGLGQNLA